MSEIPVLRLSGEPEEMGRTHGVLAKDAVAQNVKIYFKRFEEEGRLRRADTLTRAEAFWEAIEKNHPFYAAMIRGVAEGAGLSIPEIVAVNIRYELLYGEYSRMGRESQGAAHPGSPDSEECTAFAVLPEASSDGHMRIGQNWDWVPGVASIVQDVTLDGGFRVLCLTEAGVPGGKIGLNSAGLGLVVNGMLSNLDNWAAQGTPFHVKTWEVLSCRSTEEARRAVETSTASCSANLLVGRAGGPGEGDALSIETAPSGSHSVFPEAGLLVHANHFVNPEALGIWEPLMEEKQSTFRRAERMTELLEVAAGGENGVSLEDLESLLEDHDGHPDSICRHPNTSFPVYERVQTMLSVIMDLHTKEIRVASGPPCTMPYQRIPLGN